jgi:hypothetical protein
MNFVVQWKGSKKKISDVYPEATLRNSKGISAFMDWNQVIPKRSFKTKVHVFIGPPGCGKTRKVYDQAQLKGKTLFSKAPGPWWDGYDNDEQVLIDDYTGSCMKPDELLRMCDRYPYKVQIKGSMCQFNSREIFITSNLLMEDWYHIPSWGKVHLAAFVRRVTTYILWHKEGCKFVEKNLTVALKKKHRDCNGIVMCNFCYLIC